MFWKTARRTLDLSRRAVVMGIVNVTPDSFSDGGNFLETREAVEHGIAIFAEGAAIIDIGGESTRPGAAPVAAEEEMRRVVPVIRELIKRVPDCVVSIDTSKAEVARAAIAHGAEIVNDVTALDGDSEMAEVVKSSGVGVVLMHMQGNPRTMQQAPLYHDVVAEVGEFFDRKLRSAVEAGIAPECIALDPGIGFGKTVEHNLTLLRELSRLGVARRPLVLGVSRKSFLGKIAATETMSERLWPTVALTALLREKGARVLRVHDVQPNVAAVRTAEALLDGDLFA